MFRDAPAKIKVWAPHLRLDLMLGGAYDFLAGLFGCHGGAYAVRTDFFTGVMRFRAQFVETLKNILNNA